MGFMHIENLYKDRTVLMFRRLFALEKAHGTGAHVAWRPYDLQVKHHIGTGSYEEFRTLMPPDLTYRIRDLVGKQCVVHGEFYGGFDGKGLGMRETYGDAPQFVVFDIKIGEVFLSVPQAHSLAESLGFEFVPYEEIDGTQEACDAAREAPSVIAVRRGCGAARRREGVVLRPLIELRKNNGDRVIAKHRNREFVERASGEPVEFDPERAQVLTDAEQIAFDFVVPMRLVHVLDALSPKAESVRDTSRVITAMIEDVKREGAGEIVWNAQVEKAIGRRTSAIFHEHLQGCKE
jgi:hypothetical protein